MLQTITSKSVLFQLCKMKTEKELTKGKQKYSQITNSLCYGKQLASIISEGIFFEHCHIKVRVPWLK